MKTANIIFREARESFTCSSERVVLFAWRLFRDRLSTKDNLLRRGVIHFDFRLCVAGCGIVETSYHLFLHCNFFGTVWHSIYSWIGISVANPLYVYDHFQQFGFCGGPGRRRCSILQVVDRIKSISYMWLKAKYVTLPLNLHGWWLSTFTMLGIG